MSLWLINDEVDLNPLPLYLFDRIVQPDIVYQRIRHSPLLFESLKIFVASHQFRSGISSQFCAQPFYEISNQILGNLVKTGRVLWIDDGEGAWSFNNAFLITEKELQNNTVQSFYNRDKIQSIFMMRAQREGMPKATVIPGYLPYDTHPEVVNPMNTRISKGQQNPATVTNNYHYKRT